MLKSVADGVHVEPIRAPQVAARLLVLLDELNCIHVLNEQFKTLVGQYGLATDNEDYDGARSALEDLEHFITFPDARD